MLNLFGIFFLTLWLVHISTNNLMFVHTHIMYVHTQIFLGGFEISMCRSKGFWDPSSSFNS